MHRIVCISATSRPDNYTARALAVVTDELVARDRSPIVFDARELTLSFPGQTPTADAERLRTAIEGAAGLVIATPEYHGCFSAMTKLIIENLGFPSVLAGKPVALVGVAAGRIGPNSPRRSPILAIAGGRLLPAKSAVPPRGLPPRSDLPWLGNSNRTARSAVTAAAGHAAWAA